MKTKTLDQEVLKKNDGLISMDIKQGSKLLAMVEKPGKKPKSIKYYFDRTGTLNDGTPYGELGAMKYVLNDKGKPVSLGFHKIIPRGNGFDAMVGAREVRLDKNGKLKRGNDSDLNYYGERPRYEK